MKCILCSTNTETILTDKLRRGEKTKVFHCKHCDLGMLESTQKDYEGYYKTEYRKEYKPDLNKNTSAEELFHAHVDFQTDRLNLIRPLLNKNVRLLEIGCSAGQFLYHVSPLVQETVGIELDAEAAQFASFKTKAKVFSDELTKTGLEKNSFDIICAFQVLEHIPDPIQFIETLKLYLKKNGTIYIEVPNLHDSLVSVYDLPFHHQFYFHTAHLYYFSKRSLEILLSRTKLSAEFYFTQDYNLLNHIHWLQNDQPQTSGKYGLSSPHVPIRKSQDPKIKESIQSYFMNADREYKKLLCNNGISSNISFITIPLVQ